MFLPEVILHQLFGRLSELYGPVQPSTISILKSEVFSNVKPALVHASVTNFKK